MKFLWIHITIWVASVISALYLSSLDYFTPRNNIGEIRWYNVFVMFGLLFLFVYTSVSLGHFLTKKFLAYGKKEFPDIASSFIWGITVALIVVVLLLLNIFHFLNFAWGVTIVIVLIVGALLLRAL
ncbi:MAG: hypothetical protein Fur003_5800 [Candidatus Dojkabacteria bacterium]